MSLLQKIRHRKGIRESLANIGWLGGDRVLRMLGAVVVGTMVARYLGPGQYGLLNYGVAIFGLFNILSNLGLDSLVVRDLALDESGEPQILGTSFVLKAAASVVTTIAAVVVARLLEPHNTTLIVIVALMSFAAISQALDVIEYFFQARTQSRFTVVPRTIVFVVGSIARIVTVFLHLGLLVFVWIAALEIVFAEIGLGISYLRFRRVVPRWNWHLSRAKEFLTESWPLLISSVMITINMRTDQVLLGKMASVEAVGNYSAALKVSEIWYAIPIIVTTTVMPRLLKSRESNPKRYYARVQTLYESMILVSVAVTAVTLFAGPLIIRLLYGRSFSAAAGILSIHIWTGIFVAVGCVGAHQYVHEKITLSVIQRTALGAVVNLILNLVWIPRWGGIGSAMATLVSYSIISYLGDAIDRRTRFIFYMKTRAYLRFWMLPRLILKGEAK